MNMLELKCPNFHGNMSTGLLAMLEAEELVNVTIAVDGKHLKAHQMVLSICSPYFKSLLLTNTCKHPIIFMKDVKYDVMKDLLHFMYEGQVQVQAEHFQTFIDTARALQIKWLTDYNDQNILEPKKTNPELTPEPQQKQTSSTNSRSASKRLSTRCKANTNSDRVSDCDTLVDCVTDQTTISKKPKLSFGNKENNSIGNYKNESENVDIPTTNSHIMESESTNRFLVDPVDETVELNMGNQYDQVFVKTEDEDGGMSGIDNFNEANDVLQQMPGTCREEPNTSDTQLAEGAPVTVMFVRCRKNAQIVVNEHRYSKKIPGTDWMTWRCRSLDDKCKAYVHLTNDNRIIFRNEHNHAPATTPYDLVPMYNKEYFLTSLNDYLYSQAPGIDYKNAKKIKFYRNTNT